jgi:O-antigen ligase
MVIPLLLAAAQNAGIVYTGRLLPWIRCAFYAALPLCMFAVIGTYSRGGFLSLAAAAFTFVMLQRRRFTALAGMIAVISIGLLVVPIPQSYYDRLETIRTYNEIGEESALSRPHFWNVALRMVAVHPFGVGLRQFEQAYDKFDFSYGRYGHRRAVHSSHMQVLAELGYPGAVIWVSLFGYAAFACLRVRSRSTSPTLDPDLRKFLRTTADALLVSMVAFIVGGGLLSLALNDLTWLTFGMVAALDRLARRALDAHAEAPVEVRSVLDMPTLLTLPAASRGR